MLLNWPHEELDDVVCGTIVLKTVETKKLTIFI